MRTPQKSPYIPESWESVNCPFCDATENVLFERFGSSLQYSYVSCCNCGLIYTNPRPTYNQHFIDAAYSSYYQYAENLQLSDLNNINESSLKMFEQEVEYITGYDKERKAVLDIGSGMGTFLLAAKKYYKYAAGLDVSVKMAEFVEKNVGVKVRVKQYEDFLPEEKFTLIHMSHVLEHVPNPNEWISHSRDVLAPGGILVINVPNRRGLSYRLKHLFYKLRLKKQFSSSWNDPARTPDHLFEPTIRSMKYLLARHRFEIIEYYSYTRKDPTSKRNLFARLMNRSLKLGSNLTFITRPV